MRQCGFVDMVWGVFTYKVEAVLLEVQLELSPWKAMANAPRVILDVHFT